MVEVGDSGVVDELAQREGHEERAGDDADDGRAPAAEPAVRGRAPCDVGLRSRRPGRAGTARPRPRGRRRRTGHHRPCPPSTTPRSLGVFGVDRAPRARARSSFTSSLSAMAWSTCTRQRSTSWSRPSRPSATSASVAEALEQCPGGGRVRRRGDVVRHRRPQRHRAEAGGAAPSSSTPTMPVGPSYARTAQPERVDHLGIGGRAGDAHTARVGHVAEQRAECDDDRRSPSRTRRVMTASQNDFHRTFGSIPRTTITSRSPQSVA